jgi:long-chain acyl-CoA synthetase
MMRLPELVYRSAERYPDALALAPVPNDSGGWSYAQVRALVKRGAAFLRGAGLTPGDRVLLYLESGAAWPVAFFSILEAGLVAVPLPAEMRVATAAGVAAFAGARLAVLGKRTQNLAGAGGVPCVPVEKLLDAESGSAAAVEGPVPKLALLAFTSGSTAQPRAVELTHANLLANLQGLLRVRQAAPGDSLLSMLPPAHLFELMVGQLAPLACGARIVYAGALLPHRILAALRDERITHALAVPALLDVLYQEVLGELVDAGALDPARREQSLAETARQLLEMSDADRQGFRASLRERIGPSFHTIVVGGAALDPAWAAITTALDLRLEVGYGLTEASPIVSVALSFESPPGSAGRPVEGVEVRLADDGEVLVRGPNVMHGYFQAPSATALALRDGWLHTGDLGYQDREGFLFITGRLKEALKTASGETLYPEEVEPYYASPLFAEWCVSGLPGPQGNDVPTLFIVPASPEVEDHELGRAFEHLRAAAPSRLRVPQMVQLADPLPRTALGKICRRRLADEWQKGASPCSGKTWSVGCGAS